MTVGDLSQDSRSRLETMLKQLDLMVGKSRMWLRTFEEVGLKAEALRKTGFEQAFGILSMASFESLANEVCNIFDDYSHYPLISISHIVRELRDPSHALYNPERYKAYLKALGARLRDDDANLKLNGLDEICKLKPNTSNSKALEQIFLVRNNFVSHKNLNQFIGEIKQSLPPRSEFECLFEWTDNFREMIYRCYLSSKGNSYIPPDMSEWSEWQVSNISGLVDFVITYKEQYNSKLKAGIEGVKT